MSTNQHQYKQVRAVYNNDTVVVYQAYNADIATEAVRTQRLDSSPLYHVGTRMTWIKPSFLWAMYRSGWSYKDINQAHILKISMSRAGFEEILKMASVNGYHTQPPDTAIKSTKKARTQLHAKSEDALTDTTDRPTQEGAAVRVQWDPERGVNTEKLNYRSIQIGIGRTVVRRWIEEWIVSIDDITDAVRRWKSMLDAGEVDAVKAELPQEAEYALPDDLKWILE